MKRPNLTKQLLIAAVMVCATVNVSAQVTIGGKEAPHSFSVLELISNQNQGLRLPQMTTDQRDAMEATTAFQDQATSAARGLMIFNITTSCTEVWSGTDWVCTNTGEVSASALKEAIWIPAFNLPWRTIVEGVNETRYETVNLFQIYQEAFGALNVAGDGTAEDGRKTRGTFSSAGAPVITFGHQNVTATDFYYVITSYDPDVIEIYSLDADGTFTYRKLVPAPPFNSFIKILMVRHRYNGNGNGNGNGNAEASL